MKTYRCRSGIILVKICGQYLLVAAKEARDISPYARQLNETGALIWQSLSQGISLDDLADQLYEEYDIPNKELAKQEISAFIEIMAENHYLIIQNE